MKNLLVSISGVRGVVGEGLTPEIALRYALVFGNYCKKGRIVLGRDPRVSGEMLKCAVVSGLLASGSEIIDLGICPTPTVEIAAEDLKAYGLVITASHNPIQWNGLKFIGPDGIFLSPEQGKKLFRMAKTLKLTYSSWNRLGRIRLEESWVQRHVEKILKLKYIDRERIEKRRPKVVLDCNNGAGSDIATLLLKALGCTVVELNCTLSGLFAHPPEPLPENLRMLCQKVIEAKADIGFALDPDGDRLAVVSDKGDPLGEESTLALAARFILGKNPGDLAVNISTSKVIDEIAEEFGVKVYRTPVGEAFVARKLKKIKGIVGGEGNGGVILPELHYGRDGLLGIALILGYLAESERSISELSKELPSYQIVKKKIEVKGSLGLRLKRLENKFRKAKMNRIDGIRFDFAESWVHIRKSNTEPVVRIISEAKSKVIANKLTNEAINILS
jgi:phosphomannomutase